MQQKKHSGKPHTSSYLPDTRKCISEAYKAVQPFHPTCQNMQIIYELKKSNPKCSKCKQQIKCCLCNSTMPLPVTVFPLYFVWIQHKLLGAYFISRALQITVWKCFSVSTGYSRSLQCQDSKLRCCN